MSDHPNPKNGWYEYQRLVLHELDRGEKERTAIEEKISLGNKEMYSKIDSTQKEILEKFQALHDEVVALKEKARAWGAASGFMVALVFFLIETFVK